MWSPIKYLFGDSEETETVVSQKPVDRSFWGDELSAQNIIKHVAFVKYITSWLEKHKIQDVPDILLKDGNENTVRQLADRIKTDNSFRFNDQTDSLADVLGVLLLYLRELRSTLVSFEGGVAQSVIESTAFPLQKVQRIKVLKLLVGSVREHHLEVLTLLCRFLHKISANSAVNNLSASIIGILFTPLLFKDFLLQKKSVGEIVNYFLFVSSLVSLSPFLFDNADIQEAEQVAQIVRSSPEKAVRGEQPVDHNARLAHVQKSLAEAGIDASRFVKLVSESKNEDGTPGSLTDEELCVRLESVDAQRKLANEYYDAFLDTIDEVDAANALSEMQGDIDAVAHDLYLQLKSPKQDGIARAIHARYPEFPLEKISTGLAEKKSVAAIIHQILSAELESAHHSIQQLLGNNNSVKEIIEKLRQSPLNKENMLETSYAFLEKFKSTQVQKLLSDDADQIAAKITMELDDQATAALFGDLFTNYIRVKYPNEPPNWQRLKNITAVHEKLDEIEKQKEEEKAKEQANTTTASSTTKSEPEKEEPEFVPEVELYIPRKCDFGDTISVVVDFKKFTPSGSDYVEINAEDPTAQHFNTYQWVNGKTVTFTAPSGCGNFYFKYFDYDGNLKGKSSMMAIGPEFEVLAQEVNVTDQKREVKLAVTQLAGKPCPDLWIGMYFQGDVNLDYITYQYCDCKDKSAILTFNPPSDGRFQFRLFPQNTYQSIASCYVYVGAKDKSDLALNADNELVVNFEINTLSNLPTHTVIWIGLYKEGETRINQWLRYFHIFDKRGVTVLPVNALPGRYVAKLFYTYPKPLGADEKPSELFKYVGKIKVDAVEKQSVLLATSEVIEVPGEKK